MALLVWSLHVKILSGFFFFPRVDPFKDENLNMIFTSDFLFWPFKREKKPSPCSLQWEEQSRDHFYSYFYLAFVFFNCFGDICFENKSLCFYPSWKIIIDSVAIYVHMMSICCVDGIRTGRILLHAACCIIHFHLHAAHGWQAPHSYL